MAGGKKLMLVCGLAWSSSWRCLANVYEYIYEDVLDDVVLDVNCNFVYWKGKILMYFKERYVKGWLDSKGECIMWFVICRIVISPVNSILVNSLWECLGKSYLYYGSITK